MEFTAPIFIVGPARSGTTLLCALVNQHRDIALLHEASLLSMFPRPDQAVRKDWIARVGTWANVFERHGMKPDDVDTTSVHTPREAALSLYRAYAKLKGKAHSGEKSPGYITMLPELFRLFPDARVILVWRDIEEICRSNLRRAKANPRTYQAGKVLELIAAYDRVQVWLEDPTFPSRQVFHASYDGMMDDAQGLMQAMCRFLEVPFDPAMTEIGSADQSFVLGKGMPLGDRLAKKSYDDEGLIGPALQGKLDRYTRRWAEQFPSGYWQKTGKDLPQGIGETPSSRELMGDRFLVRLQVLRSQVKRTIFAHIPLGWWSAYRRFRSQGR